MRTERLSVRMRECARSRKGTTMIELLVAFMLVVIMAAVFTRALSVSTRMLSSSQRIMKDADAFNEAYYKKSGGTSATSVISSLQLQVNWVKSDTGNKTDFDNDLTNTGVLDMVAGKEIKRVTVPAAGGDPNPNEMYVLN